MDVSSVLEVLNLSRLSLVLFCGAVLGAAVLRGLLNGQTHLLPIIAIPIMPAGIALGGAIVARLPNTAYKPVPLAVLIVLALSSGLRGLPNVLG